MRAYLNKGLALVCLAVAMAPSPAEDGKKAKKEWEGTWQCQSKVVSGKAEDAKLQLEFRRICDGKNALRQKMPNLDIRLMDKKHNSTGLQLADLVAHPIGRHAINPDQSNRAYELLEPKFRRGPGGRVLGFGRKIFP